MSKTLIMTDAQLRQFGFDVIDEYKRKNEPEAKVKEWLSKEETIEFLETTSSTLDSLRHKRLVEFNTYTRPYVYKYDSLVAYKKSKAISASHG